MQVYLRYLRFRQEILEEVYWPYWYRFEFLVFGEGLRLGAIVEEEIGDMEGRLRNGVVAGAKKLIGLL